MRDRPLAIPSAGGRRQRLVAIGVALLAEGLAALLATRGGVATVAGVAAMVVLGVVLAWLVLRAVSPRPVLVLGTRGFTEQASLVSAGFVAWSEIGGIAVESRLGQPCLAIGLRDPEELLRRAGPLRRGALLARGLRRRGAIVVPVGALPVSVPKLVTAMESSVRAAERRAASPFS